MGMPARSPVALARAVLPAVLCLALGVAPPAARAAGSGGDDARLAAAVDAYVQAERRLARIPGVAVGVCTPDRVRLLRGWGTADATGDPVTPDTRFMIGSVAKTFTALAVMTLVEAGRVDLDAPVVRWVPGFRVADPVASARVTVRQLLNHTSGLPGSAGFLRVDEEDRGEGATARFLDALAGVRLVSAPGAAFHYSNANYVVLGEVVRAASGVPYGRFLAARVFGPLGMARTAASAAWLAPPDGAQGHQYWAGVPLPAIAMPFNRAYVPVGLQVSTARDLLRYAQELLRAGAGAGRLVSAETVRRLQTPTVAMPETRERYALGWVVRDITGVRVVSHVGVLPQYRASVILVPEGPWAVVALMNASTALLDARLQELPDGVVSLVAGRPPRRRAQHRLDLAVAGGLPLAGALELVAAARFLRRRRVWRRCPERRPAGRGAAVRHVWLPLAAWAAGAAALIALPRAAFGTPFRVVFVFQPDLASLLAAMTAFALLWGAARGWLAWRALRVAVAPVAGRVAEAA